jgi:segregation and condensation protein A
VAIFKIKIPDFEGPLDLLLFFIKRDELDIYDIPIAHITKEFLRYINLMQKLDLELAGEFIVMAATLMQIKAHMLLPHQAPEEENEEFDPRTELTQKLLEYKRFKESALELQRNELDQRVRFFRGNFKHDVTKADIPEEENVLQDVTMYHLIRAFQYAITHVPQRVTHEVRDIPYTIEEQARFIIGWFEKRNSYNFFEILSAMKEKIQIIVTFIALLELIRAQRVRIEIYSDFNDFQIISLENDIHR